MKVGKTKDIVLRLRNYNVGRIKEVELKYFALVKNSLLIEHCIKLKLKANQVFENKAIFKVEPKILKKVIDDCYCKYVTSKKMRRCMKIFHTYLVYMLIQKIKYTLNHM